MIIHLPDQIICFDRIERGDRIGILALDSLSNILIVYDLIKQFPFKKQVDSVLEDTSDY